MIIGGYNTINNQISSCLRNCRICWELTELTAPEVVPWHLSTLPHLHGSKMILLLRILLLSKFPN